MTMNDLELEIAIERMLAGESPEVVAHDYPLHRDEVLQHAVSLKQFMEFRKQAPNPEGLTQALSSIKMREAQQNTVRSPFTFVSIVNTSIWRGAFVLPLLFVVLVASGAYFFPWNKANAPVDLNANPESATFSGDSSATTMAQSADMTAGNTPRLSKTTALQASEAPQLPQDQALSNVVAPEITQDNNAVNEDASQASTAADDTRAVEPYNNIYDAKSF